MAIQSITLRVSDDILKLYLASESFDTHLTHEEVRAILLIVRQLKTRLEVLDAAFENKI